ncbi:hypothetical protein A464_1602 [Salmonella bongori N268-08]|uniref:Uncharacterized protein n=1 Tax=Salmonella bongori N268-08 TaxID=1197719 RepID=S5NEX2_SALBN|nr:hypothetical protein A464_1602 [Salmonella bongori N268-08]
MGDVNLNNHNSMIFWRRISGPRVEVDRISVAPSGNIIGAGEMS